MQRVLAIGCPGAGESTFSRKLSAKTGLSIHYLDMIWHKPDRTNISQEEFDKRLERILRSDDWIIDGNYLRPCRDDFRSVIRYSFLIFHLMIV